MSNTISPTASALVSQPIEPSALFHAGELAMQRLAGVEMRAQAAGQRGIRPQMPDQHRTFFSALPLMVFGGCDGQGQPWATLRAGTPGFVSSPDASSLVIQGGSLTGDPLTGHWREGAPIAGLGIQLETRRRNRVNGVITGIDGDTMHMQVKQSFGNCPKYIQRRVPVFHPTRSNASNTTMETRTKLNTEDRALIAHADTFFIASATPYSDAGFANGADVSHRGGLPGFVRIDDDSTLTTPDFAGNHFFNTLGNLLLDPRAGLLFIDFDTGDLLYLAVRAEVIIDSTELSAFAQAERLVRFHLAEIRRSRAVLPFTWSEAITATELLPAPGAAMGASAPSKWRSLRIASTQDETPSVRSFYLEDADGKVLPAYRAGQFLPIRIHLPGQTAKSTRTYTLSDSPESGRYRISVKRDGLVSQALHDHFTTGMQIDAMPPRGEFVYDLGQQRPTVWLSAGIGITPMIAMLHQALAAAPSSVHALHFFHGAQNDADRPFHAHLLQLADSHAPLKLHLFNSAEPRGIENNYPDFPHITQHRGRIDIDALRRLLPFDDYDFYLCGPETFMRTLYDGLRALNIADERIRFEAFGPASVRRSGKPSIRSDISSENVTPVGANDPGIPVRFARSRRDVKWTPKSGTLLELAEASGIDAPSSCRAGMCGTCSTRVLEGRPSYRTPPEIEVDDGCVLMCIAEPVCSVADTKEPATLTLDL